MNVVSETYFESFKRYWRRRRYQRLDAAHNRKKRRVTSLGTKTRRVWKIRPVSKLRFKVVSPIKLMAKFHDSYVDMMIRLVGDKNGLFGGKRIPRGRPVPMVSSNDEIVDGRLVSEIYKRLVSSRESAVLA